MFEPITHLRGSAVVCVFLNLAASKTYTKLRIVYGRYRRNGVLYETKVKLLF